MRQLSDTAAVSAEGPEIPSSPFLAPGAAVGLQLIGLRARKATTEWGPRAYVDVTLPAEAGTPAAGTEYTVSFTDRSRSYNQVLAWLNEEKGGQAVFPVLFGVGTWGRSFELTDAPAPTEENQVAGRFRGAQARKVAADKLAASKVEPSAFDGDQASAKVAILDDTKAGMTIQEAFGAIAERGGV